MSDLVRGYARRRSSLQLELLDQLPDPAAFKTQFPTVKYVFQTLADLAHDKTNVARVSIADVAAVTLQGRDTVKRAIAYLERIGEVSVSWGKPGRSSTTTVRFPGFEVWDREQSESADRAGKLSTMQQFSQPNRVDHAERSSQETVHDGQFQAEGNCPQNVHEMPHGAAISEGPNRNARAEVTSSSGTGSAFPHPESKPGAEAREQTGRREGNPSRGKVVRSPTDPRVRRRIAEIRAADGPRAAAAYQRTVEEAWNRQRAADALTEQLAQEAGGIGDMPS
jgi:hypothetical protein